MVDLSSPRGFELPVEAHVERHDPDAMNPVNVTEYGRLFPGASLSEAAAQRFARDWVAAWNRRDAEAVLAHYADDAVFHSPKAERILGNGRVEGKESLRAYWKAAQSRIQTLEFVLEAAHYSPRSDTLTVVYQAAFDGQAPTRATEVMQFSGGRIVRGEAFYGATGGVPEPR
ncbi:MAG TPA: nuclear transport factor 2 family protein [Polyangiaceae bacterium]|jgi:ketosteroid isomerase-like protein|nr:nuclear transport factor 2 family protein [Polyangiaceae bacterium]